LHGKINLVQHVNVASLKVMLPCLRDDKIQWRQIPYNKPGDKPFTRKEHQRIPRMEDRFEAEALEISLGLPAYDPSVPPPDPIILQPELHVNPCSLCYVIGHTTMHCPELCPLCINTGD
jgi:hypothetical protein